LKTTILSVSNASFDYPGGRKALRNVTFEAAEGDSLGIVGPSGAGKTTLLLHLNGLLRGPGEVAVCGEVVTRNNLARIRSKVGFVFQDPNDQLFMPTILEDVLFGPSCLGVGAKEAEARAVRILEAFGLGEELERSPDLLSLGQKKKAALAGVLVMEPVILVLDEPTANLDPRARRLLIDDLRRLDNTKVIASHDLDFVWATCGWVVLLDGGAVVADGPCRDLLQNRALLEAHGLEVPLSALVEASKPGCLKPPLFPRQPPKQVRS